MNDMLLAREEIEDGFNLALGSPNIIRKYLKFPSLIDNDDYDYPNNKGLPSLLTELNYLYPKKYIIITNGAKQAILAGLYSLKHFHAPNNYLRVHHKAPYWISYPTLSELTGLTFQKKEPHNYNNYISCITSPSNPTGEEFNTECDLLDAVYAHPFYSWSGKHPKHKIMVSSASKILGLPGARIGWLITSNKKLAEWTAKYIEITCSGICVIGQRLVANALCYTRINNMQPLINDVRKEILTNGEIFNHYLGNISEIVKGIPSTSKGAFAFFKVSKNDLIIFNKALQKSKVTMVPGEACGMDEPGWFRMNACQLNDYTEAALSKIKQLL